ncbi:uncharacterized protein LOC141596395 isoform X2 [Silene latifolia]|uniref:uncharacterized protein LOC141596395 isoform X2 n=1 Tax=Silene latifolia TaxID=37657 RepID=UPI003D77B451
MDVIEGPIREPDAPLRMPITHIFKDMGTVVMGKIESGSIREGVSLIIMPNKAHVKVTDIYTDGEMENKVTYADQGENIRVRLSGIDDEDILPGFVLSSISGYKAILHIHSIVEECEIVDLLQQIDPQTRIPMMKPPLFVKSGAVVLCRIRVNNLICVEKFSDFPQLGRFTLRKEGKTVAVGKIIDLSSVA